MPNFYVLICQCNINRLHLELVLKQAAGVLYSALHFLFGCSIFTGNRNTALYARRWPRCSDCQHTVKRQAGGDIGPWHSWRKSVLPQKLSWHKAKVILKAKLVTLIKSVTKSTLFSISADFYCSSDLSVFMLSVYCDELITDTDRQLIRGEILHVQINDIAILFYAHLQRKHSC